MNNILDKIAAPEHATNLPHQTETTKVLLNLQKKQEIHIMKSDKGRNIVIWSTLDYDREATRLLADDQTYQEMSKPDFTKLLIKIHKDCCDLSENLLALKHITPTEDDAIRKRKPEGSKIYFLPKTHKEKQPTSQTFPGRPIVATYSSTTYLLDKYISEITGQLLPFIPGSLIDTQDFINSLPNTKLPDSSLLITADVNSLYPNIPWQEGMEASTQLYKNNFDKLKTIAVEKKRRHPPNPRLFRRILELVLTNSMISFKNKRFFKQIKGTAMGCCISVYFANCYMFAITRHTIEHPPIWLISFSRYIDDLFFIITTNGVPHVNGLMTSISNDSIHYELTPPAKKQNFLDTSVTITTQNTINITPYSKDTASGAYLHPRSMHPGHTIRATPYSQLLRIRRISSNVSIYKKHAKKMIADFTNMGYCKQKIMRTHRIICKKMDQQLFNKKPSSATSQAFKFIINFDMAYDWSKMRTYLAELHGAILAHYKSDGPNQNKKFISLLEKKQIKLVFSNKPNINTFFSRQIKSPD